MMRGTQVAKAYAALTIDGSGINEEIIDAVEDAGPGVEKAGDDIGDRFGTRFSKRFRSKLDGMTGKIGARLNKDLGEAGAEAGNLAGEQARKSFSKKMSDKMFDADFVERIGSGFASQFLDAVQDRLDRGELTLSVSGNASSTASGIRGGGSGEKSFGDRIGRFLGAGSRNNALNLLGKSMGNIIDLMQKVGSVGKPVFAAFSKGFSSAAEGAGLLQKAMAGFAGAGGAAGKGLGSAFSSLAASGPAAALAIGAVVIGATVLTSVLSGLLGIVAALAATVASALVGALAVGAGAFTALIAAGGLATVMFTSLTDAQRKLLSDGFKPVKEVLTGLGQIMAKDFLDGGKNVTIWAGNLTKALTMLAPLARVMGNAFAIAGTKLTGMLDGPGFQKLTAALTTELPGIVSKFAGAFRSFGNGVAAVFAAIMPFVGDFARSLADVAREFSKWANSAEGQNKIKDFMDRAVTAGRSLWNFIKSLGGLLSDVLFNRKGQDSGNGMFDGMTAAIERFRVYIGEGGRLEKWFKNARKFGEKLGKFFEGLGETLTKLDNEGTLEAVGIAIEGITDAIKAVNKVLGPMVDFLGVTLPAAAAAAVGPLKVLQGAINGIKNFSGITSGKNSPTSTLDNLTGSASPQGPDKGYERRFVGRTLPAAAFDLLGRTDTADSLQQMGNEALWQTSKDHGGYMENASSDPTKSKGGKGKGGKGKYKNPYVAWAMSLVDNGPSMAVQIKKAIREFNKEMKAALESALAATEGSVVTASMTSLSESMKTSAEQIVEGAQSALNSAAENLASATTKKGAKQALKEVKKTQKDLATALAGQKRLEEAAKKLDLQGVLSAGNVAGLLAGMHIENATLADFAEARGQLAVKIEEANQKLTEAIALRDDYAKSVADSIRSFGDLTSAQAQSINGVEQALTHADITSNLQARLSKIRDFQANLRVLLAQGLSQAAYKQIVDAGVEGGSAYAAALVAGGTGAVGQVNDLISQISAAGDSIGGAASTVMYQAGVDAARGLVEGLESLSRDLDWAATRLGERIAQAVRDSLGIASPSKVMLAIMDNVGDTTVAGLDAQHSKVGRAAARFSDQIAVSPEVAAHAARSGATAVSGNQNDPRFRDLIVQTPTEDPMAVAHEVLNEVTGRLP